MSQSSGSFVAVGHSTRDITTLASGEVLPPEIGGTVSFGAATALHHGLNSSIVTSDGSPEELQSLLPQANIVNVPSDQTTLSVTISRLVRDIRPSQQPPPASRPVIFQMSFAARISR
jgi:hypothetical protein